LANDELSTGALYHRTIFYVGRLSALTPAGKKSRSLNRLLNPPDPLAHPTTSSFQTPADRSNPEPHWTSYYLYTCVPLSSSSMSSCQPKMVISLARKVTADLLESSDSLYHRVYDHVICELTAKKPGSASSQTLVIEYGTISYCTKCNPSTMHRCIFVFH